MPTVCFCLIQLVWLIQMDLIQSAIMECMQLTSHTRLLVHSIGSKLIIQINIRIIFYFFFFRYTPNIHSPYPFLSFFFSTDPETLGEEGKVPVWRGNLWSARHPAPHCPSPQEEVNTQPHLSPLALALPLPVLNLSIAVTPLYSENTGLIHHPQPPRHTSCPTPLTALS